MSVHQTREYFKNKYGYIVDNPNVGPDITSAYWVHGNSRPFLDLVKDLTGKELSGDAWIDALKDCLLYTSPSPRDKRQSRMPSSA